VSTPPAPRALDVIFRPRSIAVIGASSRPGSIGREMVHNLITGNFQGKLFPVNPGAEFIHSIKAYPSVLDIPDEVDLAIVAVHAQKALPAVDECGRKGVKGLVMITAGFKEIGPEGAAREKELVALCRRYGMRLVGPNCLGVFNADPAVSLNATFAPGAPLAGPVGFVSQSGALGVAVWTAMQKQNLGFSQFVSIGNKPDVSGNDLLEYWQDDPATTLIAMYIESFGNPRHFTHLARSITRRKPILVVKSGRTTAGMKAASSHTGALTGLDQATDALLRQTGVIRARSIEDLMALIQGFVKCPRPPGGRVAVLTNAGGPGILATDALVGYQLPLAELTDATRDRLRQVLPAEASVHNPVDMIAGATAESFRQCLGVLLEADEVDLVLAAFVPPIMVDPMDVVHAVTETARGSAKPVLMVLMAEEVFYTRIPREVPDAPPLYRYPETAAYVAAELVHWSQRAAEGKGAIPEFAVDREAAGAALADADGWLAPDRCFRLLEAYGIPVAPWRTAGGVEEAFAAADELGYPVALKLMASGVLHKSDVGGVALDLKDQAALGTALARMLDGARHAPGGGDGARFLLQRMVPGDREVILGLTTDPVIGPILVFGMGGRYVEVLQDIALRVHPITDVNAGEMVRAIRGWPILAGVRGEAPVAVARVEESLLRLSALITDHPELVEIDLNPMRLGPRPGDCRVVDARMRVARAP